MRGNEWAPLYLLIVLAIAAVLLITFAKPLMRQAAVTADTASKEAAAVSKSAVYFAALLPESAVLVAVRRKLLRLFSGGLT